MPKFGNCSRNELFRQALGTDDRKILKVDPDTGGFTANQIIPIAEDKNRYRG